ncbi:hypothetical protein SPRG_20237 [Saprolegnia parasitica CBS 223.65]|uniref:DDHD domain-containing protein n=1 Tax=Saprolegnia parasitica (strain CBS 223.65) TaxID=695850 RepID=A0A067CNF6_SAPPC|nr:hypothetical protein SPRG_20237 [Saprolegnia parasitica CBS 223.65]KDO28076.1 hypothetical protein SPRG_20237 [Saprolegnia parasitica CBS 223.65]|eukprot:XP_012201223.1 hypothetical protein SPRG_20237 [Saprolegnia parasitica CBS 223.65]
MGKAETTMSKQVPWAYLRKGEWTILAEADCAALEACKDYAPVVVDNGRLEVSVPDRTLRALYWDEPPCPVVRSDWIFEATNGKFIPLPEAEAMEINNLWAMLPTSETHTFSVSVVDHMGGIATKTGSTKAIAATKLNELFAKCSPTGQFRCKALHHGFHAWPRLRSHVDHLVFVVHGIGETYCKKRLAHGTIIDQSLVLRQSSETLLSSHFPAAENRSIEYLPVDWSDVLGDMGDDVHALLNRIALDSMPFVRQLTNELLSDILLYMARQDSVLSFVTKYMNARYTLYKENHPDFSGRVSIMGHSLGSIITYDLLAKQGDSCDPDFALAFSPYAFFAFGSPIGLFLTLRGNVHGMDLALPTCELMYNVFHPADPVAYRLEPLIHKDAAIAAPVRINTASGWRRIHHVVQDMADSFESSQKKFAQTMEQTFKAFLPKDASPAIEPSAAIDVTADANALQKAVLSRLNPKTTRLDYVLPESEMEALTPLAALTAHTGYWSTTEFILFVLTQLLGDPVDAAQQ